MLPKVETPVLEMNLATPLDFLLEFLWIFCFFFGFWYFFRKIWDCFWFLWIPYKVTKVTTNIKVTAGNLKWPKMGQNGIIRSFLPKGQKETSTEGRNPPQELEVGPCSGP